jgi:hypothetical protein
VASGRDAVQREGKEVRQRVVVAAHVVACTLSSAGGELAALLPPDVRFDALIIDEVTLRTGIGGPARQLSYARGTAWNSARLWQVTRVPEVGSAGWQRSSQSRSHPAYVTFTDGSHPAVLILKPVVEPSAKSTAKQWLKSIDLSTFMPLVHLKVSIDFRRDPDWLLR